MIRIATTKFAQIRPGIWYGGKPRLDFPGIRNGGKTGLDFTRIQNGRKTQAGLELIPGVGAK